MTASTGVGRGHGKHHHGPRAKKLSVVKVAKVKVPKVLKIAKPKVPKVKASTPKVTVKKVK